MADLMVEALQATPRAEAEAQLRARTAEPIFGLAGRPTVIQMQWLVDEVRQRGGTPQTAEAYKDQYLVRHRSASVTGPTSKLAASRLSGSVCPARWSSWPHFMHAAWPVTSPPAPTRLPFEKRPPCSALRR